MAKVKLNISLDEEIKEKLQEMSKEQGLNISALITTWVNDKYDSAKIKLKEEK